MTEDERWSHLPEPLQALLRELCDKAAARVRAKLEGMRRAFLVRRWGEATARAPDAGDEISSPASPRLIQDED